MQYINLPKIWSSKIQWDLHVDTGVCDVELEISYNITKKEKIAIRFIGLYYLKKMKDVYIWTWRLKKEWKILHNIIYFVSRNQTSISAKKN